MYFQFTFLQAFYIYIYKYNQLIFEIMKTYTEIIETINNEIKAGKITSVKVCRDRIQVLCIANNQSGNMFSIALRFNVA